METSVPGSSQWWSGMSEDHRAVSTVADAALAIVLIVAAMGVLVAFVESDDREHDPIKSEHTAQTVTASTMNTTYNVSDAVDHLDENYSYYSPYEGDQLERVSHGAVGTQVADVAVANIALAGQQVSREAEDYEAVLDEQLQAALVDSQFDTQISAYWTPLDGVGIEGVAEIGQTPPHDADVSTTTVTVASGFPDASESALAATNNDTDYRSVAEAVADATVEGYLPELESQRALESSGLDYLLTTYRYNRFANVLVGHTDDLEQYLTPFEANASAANEYLSAQLTDELTEQLESLHGDVYDSSDDAGESVSISEVTITVRTWT